MRGELVTEGVRPDETDRPGEEVEDGVTPPDTDLREETEEVLDGGVVRDTEALPEFVFVALEEGDSDEDPPPPAPPPLATLCAPPSL